MTNKVRAAMRKPGGVQAGDTVALALSNGTSSTCLLYLMRHLRSFLEDRRERYKIPFKLVALHIEEETDTQECEDIVNLCTSNGIKLYIYHLSDIFRSGDGDCPDGIQVKSSEHQSQLQSLLSLVTDATGKHDLKNILKRRLLMKRALEHGCQKILFGHTSDRMAAEAISSTAKGQGYALSTHTQTVDSRCGNFLPNLVYCMKDLSKEEVHCLSSEVFPDLLKKELTGAQTDDSIDKKDINELAKSFISLVQSSNPGGVSNIMSSISKLVPFDWDEQYKGNREDATNQHGEQPLCTLCFAPIHQEEIIDGKFKSSFIASTCVCCRNGIFGCITVDDIHKDQAQEVLKHLPPCITRSMEEDAQHARKSCS